MSSLLITVLVIGVAGMALVNRCEWFNFCGNPFASADAQPSSSTDTSTTTDSSSSNNKKKSSNNKKSSGKIDKNMVDEGKATGVSDATLQAAGVTGTKTKKTKSSGLMNCVSAGPGAKDANGNPVAQGTPICYSNYARALYSNYRNNFSMSRFVRVAI